MNVTDLRSRIQRAETRLATLRPWVATLEAAREQALRSTPPADDPAAVADHRQVLHVLAHGYCGQSVRLSAELEHGLLEQRLPGLAAARDELADLERAVVLLREDLPSPEAVARAAEKAKEAAEAARSAEERYEAAWLDLLPLARDLEAGCRELISARHEALDHGERFRSLTREWDLNLERTGGRPELPQAVTSYILKTAQLLGATPGATALDGNQLDRELRAARAALEAVEEAA